MSDRATIAFIGLGIMGKPIARNLFARAIPLPCSIARVPQSTSSSQKRDVAAGATFVDTKTAATDSGVDPAIVRRALLGGFASSRVLEVHGQRLIDAAFAPGFKAKLHRKDLEIVDQIAKATHKTLPAAALVLEPRRALEAKDSEIDHGSHHVARTNERERKFLPSRSTFAHAASAR